MIKFELRNPGAKDLPKLMAPNFPGKTTAQIRARRNSLSHKRLRDEALLRQEQADPQSDDGELLKGEETPSADDIGNNTDQTVDQAEDPFDTVMCNIVITEVVDNTTLREKE